MLAGTSVAEANEVKLPEVMDVDGITNDAVTVPDMAGSDAMVTLFPIVTDEIEIGTVPLIDAVTLPICDVPVPRVTEPEIDAVTAPPTVTALARSWVLVRDASANVTVCEDGKLRIETLPVVAPNVTD